MDVAMDLYLAIPLLFTILALVLAFVFMKLRRAKREQPQEPAAAKVARESGPGDQAAAGARPEAGKEVAAEQREEAAEEPSPAAEPSPVAAESIPQQQPTEPGEPDPQEDARDHAAFPSKAEEEDLDSEKEKLVVREPASTAATPAPVTSAAASFESSGGFEWPLGTLGTCLLIVMGVTMLAHIHTGSCKFINNVPFNQ